jgi:S-(hydroxymethyl)glutathione dehydrogenase/alcohol dehydrogenase
MVAAGLCHSDYHWDTGDCFVESRPLLLGHEGAGVVEEVGEGVTTLAAGDRVVIAWHVPCGECRTCARGDERRCANYLRGARKMRRARDSMQLSPVLRTGGYADALVVHAACAVRMPAELPFEQACLLACGFSTGAGAALWTTPVQPGSSVAVIGCGGVGLAVVQGARLAGAARIVAIDTVPEKLELALELGATEAVEAGTEVKEIDHAFSAIGAPQGLVDAIRMCAYGGTACLVGVPPSKRTLDIDIEMDLFARHVTIGVTHGGDVVPQQDFPFLAQAALDGKLDLAKFVTATCTLEEVPDALEALHRPTGVRTVALF